MKGLIKLVSQELGRKIKEKNERRIGVEIEYPVVDKTFKFFSVYHVLIEAEEGEEIIEEGVFLGRQITNAKITTDIGEGLLEIAAKPVNTVDEAEKIIKSSLRIVKRFLKKRGWILGYGIQPISKETPVPPRRLYHILLNNHPVSAKATVSAASQVHIDIFNEKEAILAVNTFNALTPIFIAIFANSPIWRGKITSKLALREYFYEIMSPEFSGIPEKPFLDLNDYIQEVVNKKCFFFGVKNGKFISPKERTLLKFLENNRLSKEETYQNYLCLESMVMWNARLRVDLGTIEIRPCCTQPPKEQMTIPALMLGLIENLEKASQIVKEKKWEEWRRLKTEALEKGLENQNILSLAKEVLEIAEEGLSKRGYNEEKNLRVLWRRIKKHENPAQRIITVSYTHLTLPTTERV